VQNHLVQNHLVQNHLVQNHLVQNHLVETPVQLFLITEDLRLSAKAERLAREFSVPISIADTPEKGMDALQSIVKAHGIVQYVLLDLDAKEFDSYALADKVQSAFPDIPIIACALVFDPSIVQKSKLHGINTVLQRFSFEDLLRKVCSGLGKKEITTE
jgi:DNA-binding NarL/FixJ family response regulator